MRTLLFVGLPLALACGDKDTSGGGGVGGDGGGDTGDGCEPRTWYADADGDGYGDPAVGALACEQPDGHAGNAADCDDRSAAASPGATEVCDGLDNDCNGAVDDDAADAQTFHVDGDGDGYGDPEVTILSCDQPADTTTVELATDCDDADASSNPGGEEVCDGADNDCDGVEDFGRRVPDDHATIQDAIDALDAGDPICIQAGTHTGLIDLSGKDHFLWGAGGAAGTTIDGDGLGPVVTVQNGENAILQGLTITGGVADQGAGVLVLASALTLDQVSLSGNSCTAEECEGVGLYAESAELQLQDTHITDNLATVSEDADGVGLFAQNGTLRALDASFSSNRVESGESAEVSGVGAFIVGVASEMDGVVVSANGFDGKGAVGGLGLTVIEGSLSATDLAVDDNLLGGATAALSEIYGVGAYLVEVDLRIDGGSFSRNIVETTTAQSSGVYGVGVLVAACDVAFKDVVVEDNVAELVAFSTLAVGSVFSTHTDGTWEGGAIRGNEIDLEATSGGAEIDGIGLALDAGEMVFTGVAIDDNTGVATGSEGSAGFGGGASFALGASETVAFKGGSFSGNHLTVGDAASGGGFLASGGSLGVSRTWIADNTVEATEVAGGGVWSDAHSFGMSNVIVAGNMAQGAVSGGGLASGGGVVLGSADSSGADRSFGLSNVDIVGNTASAEVSAGGGLYVARVGNTTDFDMVNGNLVNNTASSSLGGVGGAIATVSDEGDGSFTVRYCNAHDNTSPGFEGMVDPGGTLGNIAVDPAYFDTSAADAGAWDLSLSTGSGCIDVGDPGVLDPDGSRSDIGAYGGPGGNW